MGFVERKAMATCEDRRCAHGKSTRPCAKPKTTIPRNLEALKSGVEIQIHMHRLGDDNRVVRGHGHVRIAGMSGSVCVEGACFAYMVKRV